MMKRIMAVVMAFGLLALGGAAAAQNAEKAYHQGIGCLACHGEAQPTVAKTFKCTGCHGTPEAVAARTERLGKRNPHTSPHWLTELPCEECHKQHKPSIALCSNSCHIWPEQQPK